MGQEKKLSGQLAELSLPISNIIGMTQLLLDTPLNNDQREFAKVIYDSAQALLPRLSSIADSFQSENGALALAQVNPRIITNSALDLMRPFAEAKKLALKGAVDAAVPDCVHGDPVRLRQVLITLIGNAIKFTDAGEVSVHAMVENQNKLFVTLRFEVRDTGAGLSPAACLTLFQPPTQADSFTLRRFGDTGLGLATCKTLVSHMNGQIGVDSKKGKGSTFWFTISFKRISTDGDGQA
jgi:signal transduction histidine kinase